MSKTRSRVVTKSIKQLNLLETLGLIVAMALLVYAALAYEDQKRINDFQMTPSISVELASVFPQLPLVDVPCPYTNTAFYVEDGTYYFYDVSNNGGVSTTLLNLQIQESQVKTELNEEYPVDNVSFSFAISYFQSPDEFKEEMANVNEEIREAEVLTQRLRIQTDLFPSPVLMNYDSVVSTGLPTVISPGETKRIAIILRTGYVIESGQVNQFPPDLGVLAWNLTHEFSFSNGDVIKIDHVEIPWTMFTFPSLLPTSQILQEKFNSCPPID